LRLRLRLRLRLFCAPLLSSWPPRASPPIDGLTPFSQQDDVFPSK
jgi:hypothetical protein